MEATSDPSAPSSTDSAGAGRAAGWALATAAALGIALGCFDLTVSILQRAPAAFGDAAALAAPLAVSAGAFFLACFVPLLLAAVAGGRSPRKALRMAALAVALGSFGALCVYFNLTRAGLDPAPRNTLVLVACLAAALGFAVYQTLRREADPRPRLGFPLAVLVLMAAAGLGLAWLRAYRPARLAVSTPAPLRSDHAVHHIILLSVDTLRRDAVSALAPGAPPTPAIDALARDSVVFERAYSPAPWTLPAFVSMMTGVPPAVHGVRTPQLRIPETLPTLAEKLRDAGYRTAAIGHNPWLRPEHGMARGFLGYDICPRDEHGSSLGSRLLARLDPMRLKPSLTTPELTELALSFLRAHRGEDFFLWVHYLKPHGPYEPPARYRPQGKPPEGMGYSFGSAPAIRMGSRVVTAAQRPWVRQLYDGEVRFVDDNVARFLAELQRLGIYDDALIVFVSDHGEEFWEHGGYEHGHSLYDEVTRVPLFLKLPGSREGRRRSDLVSTGSLMPTLLDLIGDRPPPESSSYASLRPLLDGSGGWIPRPVMSSALLYFEERQSAVFEDFKYVRTPGSESEAIFDLGADPAERHDVAAFSPDRVRLGRAAFAEQERLCLALRDHFGIHGSFTTELKPGALEQLRSLGYVQ